MKRQDKRVEFAIRQLINSDGEISVAQLAAAAGLSSARFSNLFFCQTSMLPSECLRLLRAFRQEQKMAAEILSGVRYEREAETGLLPN